MAIKSWYKTTKQFNELETVYIELLEKSFSVRDERGQKTDYNMTDYQKEFHAESINIKRDNAKDILFIKARGVSFTFSSCIELIMTAYIFENQIVPIIAQRQDTAKSILKICKWLIENAKINFGEIEVLESQIRFKKTGSVLSVFPSSSASDAVRGIRTVRCLLDEFAYQQRDKELLSSVQDTMQGSLGQILIGSTPCGINNHFYTLIKNPIGFEVFRLPVFDEKKFNKEIDIMKQDLIPIAPWIDIDKLEMKRKRDSSIFMQEQMCSFMDDSTSFFSYSLIKRCEVPELINYVEGNEANGGKYLTYKTTNPIVMGVDVARTTHLTAVSIYEIMDIEGKKVHVQRGLKTIKATDLTKQQDVIEELMDMFPSTVKVRIDMTGIGLGLYEYLKKKRGMIIEGINFGRRIKTGEPKTKAKIRDFMIITLKNKMIDGNIQLLEHDLQQKHMTTMNYEFEVKEDEFGHGDILFANALATLPFDFSVVASDPLLWGGKSTGAEEVPKEAKNWDMQNRLDWLKRRQKETQRMFS